jgi:hypothetical protein
VNPSLLEKPNVVLGITFEGSNLFQQRQNFERKWKEHIQHLEQNSQTIPLPQDIMHVGRSLATTWKFGENKANLAFFDCGTLSSP